jgi:hypothetical protein
MNKVKERAINMGSVPQFSKKELNRGALLYGLGKGLWKGDNAQEYVNLLREDRILI